MTTIAEYSKTEAALAELRMKYGRDYDVKTPGGMAEARLARGEIKKYRTDLEKMRVEIKAPALERCKQIDAEAKRITAELEALEQPIDIKIKAEEARREEEKAAAERVVLQRKIDADQLCSEMRAGLAAMVGRSAREIADAIGSLHAVKAPDNEHAQFVAGVKDEVFVHLNRLYAVTLEREEEAKRLADERAAFEAEQRAARAAAEKEAAEQKAARDAIEAEQRAARARIEAEQRAADEARAKADAKAAKERAEAERIAAAERDAETAKLRAEAKKLEAQRVAQQEKEHAEKVAAEQKARDLAAKKQKTMDGFALLAEFLKRHGEDEAFATIAKPIAAWLSGQKKKAVA